jgi:hypothetical protein
MRLSPRTRAVILALALAATLVAAFAPEEQSPAASGKAGIVAAAPRRTATAEPVADIPDIAILRPMAASPTADPFSPNAWLPPPPPAAKPAPPPPPVAPPFPYAYLGRVDDAGKASVLLGRADKSLTAQAGDLIDGVWRVDKIAERSIELIYQPLSQRQTLSAGSDQ